MELRPERQHIILACSNCQPSGDTLCLYIVTPSVTTFHTIEEERHPFLCACREIHCLVESTFRTFHIPCTWQCWVCSDILEYDCALLVRVGDLIAVDTPVGGGHILCVPTIAANIGKASPLPVLLWVQQIIALWTELELWSSPSLGTASDCHADETSLSFQSTVIQTRLPGLKAALLPVPSNITCPPQAVCWCWAGRTFCFDL